MPRPAINDYTFYKIVNINCDLDLCYVGSSCNMKLRARKHKYNCNNIESNRHHLKLYTTIREHGGWEEFKIVELGYREQITLIQAHMVEEEYRIGEKANLNMNICFRSDEYIKIYEERNKKEWNDNNRELINTRRKERRVVCECGAEIRKDQLKHHLTSQKHIKLMNAKTD